MAACLRQIKTITALAFCLFVLIINRMLTTTVFNKAKGTGSASNKALKTLLLSNEIQIKRKKLAILSWIGEQNPCPFTFSNLFFAFFTDKLT
ncbi:hypothetical protein AV940_02815 [Alteromonas sp. Mac2]|nr:hypothetical protein AV940_02815 [Alteromonas sp. Mac2]